MDHLQARFAILKPVFTMGQEIFDKGDSLLEFVFLVTGDTMDHQNVFFMTIAFYAFCR